jgi:hypothetical protein
VTDFDLPVPSISVYFIVGYLLGVRHLPLLPMNSKQNSSAQSTPSFGDYPIPKRDWLYFKRALSLATGIRIAIFIIGYIVGREVLDRSGSLYPLMQELLCRWDTIHYLAIAEHGYSYTKDTEYLLGNFPLFPLLIKIVSFVFRDFFVSSLFISFAASVTAGYFLQKLVSLDADDHHESGKALWYFYLFPTAYFLVVPYSESVFLALSMASFYFARQRQWLTSGLMAALSSATRVNGIILLPALCVEAFLQERKIPSKQACWLLLSPLGLLAHLFNIWYISGNAMIYFEMAKTHFSTGPVLPWDNVTNLFGQYLNSPPSSFKTISVESVLVPVFITALLLLTGCRWLRISYQIYAWIQMGFLLSTSWVISYPRYALAIFPIFIVLARLGRNEQIHTLLSVTTALCMGGLFAIFASGRWAF